MEMNEKNDPECKIPMKESEFVHNSSHKPKQELSANVLVLDSLQSWIICLATFLILVLNTTFTNTLNITFLQLIHLYGVSITSASLGYTLQLVALGLSSVLVTSTVVPKTGERVATVAGGVVSFISTLVIGYATNLAVYLVGMTIKGACIAMTTIPATSMISQYFDKRKSLATAAALGGIAVGSMGAPPFIKFFLETYGLRGTFLIIAGLQMNVICMGMLLRPTSHYKKILRHEEISKPSSFNGVETELETLILVDDKTLQDSSINKGPSMNVKDDRPLASDKVDRTTETLISSKFESECGKDTPQLYTTVISSNVIDGDCGLLKTGMGYHSSGDTNSITEILKGRGTNNVSRDESSYVDTMNPISDIKTISYEMVPSVVSSDIKDVVTNETANKYSEKISDSKTNISCALLGTEKVNGQYNLLPKIDSNTSGVNVINRSRHISSTWSVISLPISESALNVDIPAPLGISHHETKNPSPKNPFFKILRWFYFAFNLNLFGLWTTRILLLGSMAGSLVQYITTYLPTIAATAGLKADQTALLLTVSGGVDFASRLIVGYFTDFKLLSTSQVVAIAQFIMGTACHFTRFYTSAHTMMILAVLLGVFGGTRQSLQTLVCLDFVGAERFVKAYGLTIMMSLLSVSVHHPLLSSLLEYTGSFNPPLHYVGVAAYLSSVCLLVEPLAKRLDSRKTGDSVTLRRKDDTNVIDVT